MTTKYGSGGCGGDESSDQEELVDGNSEMDDEMTDMDEMQFTYCKTDASILNPTEANESFNTRGGSATQATTSTVLETRLKLSLLAVGLCLLSSTIFLLVLQPLYMKQLELGGDGYTAYGSLLFVSTTVTVIFVGAATIVSSFSKWTIKFYQLPIPAKG